jgi:hypothetical protein
MVYKVVMFVHEYKEFTIMNSKWSVKIKMKFQVVSHLSSVYNNQWILV